MDLERAQRLQLQQIVHCPEDRGDAAYTGKVVYLGTKVETNHQGAQYIWVTVKHPSGSKHVWPSNRLG